MRRKQATALIDEIRTIVAEHDASRTNGSAERGMARIRDRLALHIGRPLQPCKGEAHSNPHIDNCSLCAPRWGWVGPVEVVS